MTKVKDIDKKIFKIIEEMPFPYSDPVTLQAVGDLKFLVKARKYLDSLKVKE